MLFKHNQVRPVFKTKAKPKFEAPAKSKLDWLGTVFKLSALCVFVFYLYGYGAAVGYAGHFGIPQSALISSPSDLLGIASETLLHQTLHFFNTSGVFAYIWSVLKSTVSLFLIYGLLFALLWFAIITIVKNERRRAYLSRITNSIFPAAIVQLNESLFKTFVRSIWHGILFVTANLAAQSALLFAIFAVFIGVVSVTIIGYSAARSHAEQDIIRPINCASIHSRVQFLDSLEKQNTAKSAGTKAAPTEKRANCVKVTFTDAKGTKTIAGRSVIAGSDYILVYETNGKATRIPLKAAVVEAADDDVLKEVELQKNKIAASKAQ